LILIPDKFYYRTFTFYRQVCLLLVTPSGIEKWTAEHLQSWLREAKVDPEIINAFEIQRIDGKKISKMNPPRLYEQIEKCMAESPDNPSIPDFSILQDTLLATVRY
jgi:hypothetical protein